MKGLRFYEEKGQGNVIAVFIEDGSPIYNPDLSMGCVSALLLEPNSIVCGSAVSREYLTEHTRRVSEKAAREIHPELFKYLD